MLVRFIAFYSMMFFTMSKGRGKMTVEFFSALILLNVWKYKSMYRNSIGSTVLIIIYSSPGARTGFMILQLRKAQQQLNCHLIVLLNKSSLRSSLSMCSLVTLPRSISCPRFCIQRAKLFLITWWRLGKARGSSGPDRMSGGTGHHNVCIKTKGRPSQVKTRMDPEDMPKCLIKN